MAIAIDTFKKIMVDLDVSGGISQQYSLSNDISNNNTCFLNFNLITNITNQNVTITFEQYTSQGGSLENTETFTLNIKNNTLSRNINIITAYTLITIDSSSFNGILSGFIEKLIIGDNISVDASGQTVAVRGGVDISGQRVDISGQYVINDDFELQNISNNINNNIQYSNAKLNSIDNNSTSILNKLSNYTYDANSKLKVDISGQRVDISGQRVDISGQSMYIVSVDASNNSQEMTSTTIDKTVFNSSGIINGLNTYQILPKIKSFLWAGFSNTVATDQLLAGHSTSNINVTTLNWGKANNRQFYFYIPSTPSGIVRRDLKYTYIDSNGDEQTRDVSGVVGGSIPLVANIVGINQIDLISGGPLGTNDYYYITDTSGSAIRAISSISTLRYYYNGIFTCPNNAIAMIKNFNVILSTTNETYIIQKWDALGNRRVVYSHYVYSTTVNNHITAGGGDYSSIGPILTAGESVGVTCAGSSSTNRHFFATIQVIYF